MFADQFTFTSPGTVTWDGVYVNPYQANDNTQPEQNPLTIYCDDWNTEFSGNPTWNADVYTLTAANVTNFKYGDISSVSTYGLNAGSLTITGSTSNPDTYDLYLEAAYLDEQLANELASADTSANKQLAQQEYSAANWLLFVSSGNVSGLVTAINGSGFGTAVFDDLSAAETAVQGGFSAPGWDVIVPVNNSFPMQEFLMQDFSGTTVPEPSAFILLGTALAGLGFIEVRRRRIGSRNKA